MDAQADSVNALLKTKYPSGEWIKNEAGLAFSKEKDTTKKLQLYNAYLAAYPLNSANKKLLENFRSQLAIAYARAKGFSSFTKWNNTLDEGSAAANNNGISWGLAVADEHIQDAKKMSFSAVSYAKNQMLHPTEKKPESSTLSDWEEARKSDYAMFSDTYAYILYKTGDYKTGFNYAKDAATISKFKDADLNERYAVLAEKVLPPTEAKQIAEQFVKEGTASAKTKEALKAIYIKQNKGEKGFDGYIGGLEASAKTQKRTEIEKSMTRTAAPKFNLKDFEGKAVSLDDLKGKVVIVDFWATWCGPCIASMPAMNKALAKYKDDDNVKFLFVDTWEHVDNKLANAQDFMKQKGYPFKVLMDTDDKMVSDFNVSGIPTKFIIDKEGKLRFTSIGFDGSDEALVDEVSTMIELAGKN